MTRIVTTTYRYKRPSSDTPKTAASGHALRTWLAAIVAAGTLLAGCMADSRPSDEYLASTATGITMPTTRTEAAGKRARRRSITPLMASGCGRQAKYETRPMASAIVRSTYRYKRPPRKRKAVALEAPAIVTTKSSRRRPVGGTEETAAEVQRAPVPEREGAVQPSTPRAVERVISPPHANDDRKPAIVRKAKPGDDTRPDPSSRDKPAIVTTGRKQRREADRPHLPMELPLSRKSVERDGDDYKRLKAAMARRLHGAGE
jgi:hypothetical protein